jgi:Flp pilus assembly protein TadD
MSALRRDRIAALAAAGASALGAGYMARQAVGEDHLERANDLALERRYPEAIAEARKADDGSTRARALRVIAYSSLASNDVAAFLPAARRALRDAPADWELRRDYAFVIALRGNRASAQREMNRALAANPLMELPFGFERPPGTEPAPVR